MQTRSGCGHGGEAGPNPPTLYLRWRPSRFAEVVGQQHVSTTLRNAVASGTIAHAYLFCGPKGTGKTSVARILYKAVNCLAFRDGEPCGECSSCLAAQHGRALDLIEIDAASNRGIEDIKELRDKVRFAPAEARYKVYIIDEVHQLSRDAKDAFLKTLEEPPRHALFVLATTEAHKVPPTIASRCQRFDFWRLSFDETVGRLQFVASREAIEVDISVLKRIARLARGSLRDALGLLDQLAAYTGSEVTEHSLAEVLGLPAQEAVRSFTEALAGRDAVSGVSLVGRLVQEGVDLHQFVEEVLGCLRGLLLLRVGAGSPLAAEFGAEELEWLASEEGRWTAGELAPTIRRLAQLQTEVRDPARLQLELEVTLAEMALGAAVPAAVPATAGSMAAGAKAAAGVEPVPAAEAEPVGQAVADHAGEPVSSQDSLLRIRETQAAVGLDVCSSHPHVNSLDSSWRQVVGAMAEKSSTMQVFLSESRPFGLEGDILTVRVASKFQKEWLEDAVRLSAVEDAVSRVLGFLCKVRFEADTRPAAGALAEAEGIPGVRAAMEVLGASVESVEELEEV